MIFCPRCKRQVEHSDSFYLPGPLCADCREGEALLNKLEDVKGKVCVYGNCDFATCEQFNANLAKMREEQGK
jgi:hypothetical protein